jgi:hypothetical protein
VSTVTHRNQPAIHATNGHVYGGNERPYTVRALLWPADVQEWVSARLAGCTLHVCSGMSPLGDCRVDLFQDAVDVRADACRLPFAPQSWDTVLIDPPYNGIFQWNHDMLAELARVARQRIIFQHWFAPLDRYGRFKKSHRFNLTEMAVWQPRTYFGRAQVISVMDAVHASTKEQ